MRRVFIYGGCTSRDAVEYYPEYNMHLQGYIARQSLISAYRPANPSLFDTSSIEGSFQRRMLQGDIISSMPKHLTQNHADIDTIIWDLMIERVGVQKVTSGGMVTRNGTPLAKGVGSRELSGSYLFGTDHHFKQWCWALGRFLATLESLNLKEKVIVNATPWAIADKHGQPPKSSSAMRPKWFNREIQRYWQAIERAGIKVAQVSQDDAIADPDHKWGPAYFHYVSETYRAQLNAITQLL